MISAEAPGILAEDEALLARAGQWNPRESLADLSVERLGEITADEGVEFATAVLHDRLIRDPAHAAFRTEVSNFASVSGREDVPLVDIIGIVPGAFHGQHKHTGADGLRISAIVRGLAPHVEVLPVRSFGRLEENASLILDWLEARHGARIALTSLSKGGADLKCALASPRAARAFASVRAWVSFSGIVQGTPLVAWLRARPLRSAAFGMLLRLQGNRATVVDELRRAPDAPLARWPTLPGHLRIVHVNGCPLPRHLRHRWAPRGHARLAPLGPNDGGGILLGDLVRLPGTVYSIWGADHYLQPSWDATDLLRAVVAAALSSSAPRQAQPPASAPMAAPASRSIV